MNAVPDTASDAAHLHFMRDALRQAKKAAAIGEVPVGCVIVHDGVVVARGYNRRETDRDALAHAELIAIRRACKALGGWRLWQCTLYVTLAPCKMCAAAIESARIRAVYYGAEDDKTGSAAIRALALPVSGGILRAESERLLQQFFSGLRSR